MAVKYLGDGKYILLAGDTKPTTAATNAQAWETDTGKLFRYNGTAWIPQSLRGGYNQIVYKDGSTYYATDINGNVLNSSTTNPGAVIQTCLDLAGRTFITAGDYTMGASFAGINIGKDGTHLDMDSSCILTVPAGYTGYVIKMQRALDTGPNLHHARISGGKLYEATGVSGSHLWTGILVKGGPLTNQGVSFCSIRDVFVEYAGTAVNQDTTLGFITGCIFENVTGSGCVIGFDFNSPTPAVAANSIARNTYINCVAQDYNSVPTLYGFKNIRYKDHIFIHCKAWDLDDTATQKAATIHQDAKNITIIGGIMGQTSAAGSFFNDESKSTLILQDEWNTPKYAGLSMTEHVFGKIARKVGRIDSSSTNSGEGLLGGNATTWATSAEAGNAEDITFASGTSGRLRTTGAVSGNGCGSKYTASVTCRGWNPIYKIMFKLNQTTNIRPFFGWANPASTADIPGGDDPLNALSGVGLAARAADTNFQIAHNDGAGATTFTDTGIALDSNIKVFELVAQDGFTNKWKWALYNESVLRSISQSMITYTELTTSNIPAQTTALKPQWVLTTSTTAARSFVHYQIYVESD